MFNLALVYHINFSHLSLSFSMRSVYIENILSRILDSLVVDSNIAICTEDLLLLREWNPECFNKLVCHPHIKFLLPLHSHTIPQLYPSPFIFEAELGKKIIYDLIPKEKIMDIGYSSEVDMFPANDFSKLSPIWNGVVLGETRIIINNLSENKYPPIFEITDGESKMRALLSRRKLMYRAKLHLYLRGEIKRDEVWDGIKEDYFAFSNNSTLLARIDLEAIILNTYVKNRKMGPSPIKKWYSLQKYLCDNNVNFCFLDKLADHNPKINLLLSDIGVNHSEDHKWSNLDLQKTVTSYLPSMLERCLRPSLFSLYCSDYYCSQSPNWVFTDPRDKTRKIVINKNRQFRDMESEIKLRVLSGNFTNNRINLKIKDKDLKKYFHYFNLTLNEISKYL